MESLVFLLGVVALVAMALAQSARKRAQRLEAMLANAQQRAELAHRHATEVDARLSAWVSYFQGALASGPRVAPANAEPSPSLNPGLEPASAIVPPSSSTLDGLEASVEQGLAVAAVTQTPSEAVSAPNVASTPSSERAGAAAAEPAAESAREKANSTPAQSGFDWERLVGVRLFAWLGGGTLFLAAALFLQFSIQQNLISPVVRVAIGLCAGIACLVGGLRLRERTPLAGDALCGAGVATLYASLFAAHSLYDLIGSGTAFLSMALVTLSAGFISVRERAYFIAWLGLLGGMSTPYLVSTGQDRPIPLWVYVTALSTGIVFVSGRMRWPSLGVWGLLGSCFLFVGWCLEYLDAARASYALLAFALVASIYATPSLRPRKQPPIALERVVAVSAVLVPLIGAMAIAGQGSMDVSAPFLAAYLIALCALSWFVGGRDNLALSPVAAALAVFTWYVRLDTALVSAHESMTYVCLAALPLVHGVAWLTTQRRSKTGPAYEASLIALLISLCGAAPLALAVLAAYPAGSFGPALAYFTLHAALLLAVGALAQRGLPSLLAQLVMLISLWGSAGISSHDLSNAAAATVLFSGLSFLVLPLCGARLRADATAWLSSALALPAHYLLLYALTASSWGRPTLGALALSAAGACLAMLALLRRLAEPQNVALQRLRVLYAGVAIIFITASIPILLKNEWVTVGWALESLGLCGLYRRVSVRHLLFLVGALGAVVGIRLLFNPALWTYHERTALPIFNYYLYTFGVPIGAFFVAARLLGSAPEARKLHLPSGLSALATVLTFVLLNIEIADFFSTGLELSFRWSGGGLAEDTTYSIAWGVFGIGLLAAGIVLRKRAARIGALAVLVLTIGKVFLHDLWALGALYRVGSIVGLAVALLGVSYLTQRFILPRGES